MHMVKVAPFKGITYNKKKIGKLDDVMSPPYDIISSEMQDNLYRENPYNFVRLILGKQYPEDNEADDRYTRSKNDFEKWIAKSILTVSDKKAIYPYKIRYKINEENKIMSGFFILLKLDPEYKQVLAHEKTLSKPKADRLNLMRQCKANLEPIQLLYIDEENNIIKKMNEYSGGPIIDVEGYDGFRHKLWKLENVDLINYVTSKLNDKILFIADGHHRYQTAINYANEMKEKTGNKEENAPFNYRMVILANIYDEGLSILPTHRLIKIPDFKRSYVLKEIGKYFTVKEKYFKDKKNLNILSEQIKKELNSNKQHKFALLFHNKYYILTLKEEGIMEKFSSERSKTWRTLDVSILHKLILENIMGINEGNIEDYVKYTRDDIEAIEQVQNNNYNCSILMNATKINELKSIAEANEHMPQKSTYFLPKMLSGLVIYKMDI